MVGCSSRSRSSGRARGVDRPLRRAPVQASTDGSAIPDGSAQAPTTGCGSAACKCNDAPMKEVDPGELERLASALRLAESALEEALEAAENLGSFDRRFDVPRAVGGAQRLVGNALEAVDAARRP